VKKKGYYGPKNEFLAAKMKAERREKGKTVRGYEFLKKQEQKKGEKKNKRDSEPSQKSFYDRFFSGEVETTEEGEILDPFEPVIDDLSDQEDPPEESDLEDSDLEEELPQKKKDKFEKKKTEDKKEKGGKKKETEKEKEKTTTVYSSAQAKYQQKIDKKKEKERERKRQHNQLMRNISNRKKKRDHMMKKTKKGQPNLNTQMKYMLQKLEK